MSTDAFDSIDSGFTESSDGAGVVSVKGQSFAIGIFWNNFENRNTAAKEAREMAAQPNIDGDLYCVRTTGTQYGIGHKNKGHGSGMVSLAGALADQRGGNWVGLFALESGYYLLAVRDDDILAETDVLIEDELDARGRFEDLMLGSEWNALFAPDGFGIDGATTTPLAEIIGRPRAPKLVSTDKVGGMLKLLVGGGIIAALIIGGMFYFQQQQEFALQEELRRLAEEFNNTVSPQETIVVPPMPWEGKPKATAYLQACIESMNRATLAIPGWTTAGLACDGTSVHMVLERAGDLGDGGGPISWIRWGLDQAGLSDASATPLASNDNQVEVVWSFDVADNYPPAVDAPRLSLARQFLQTKIEDTFTPVSFPSGPVTNEFFSSLGFTFTTPFDPNAFDPILREVPGLTIERVVLDLTELSYKIDGSVHEQIYFPETQNANLN